MEISGLTLTGITMTAPPPPPPPPPPPGWSAGGTMNTGRDKLAACGTPTATLGMGGYISASKGAGTFSQETEEYDGSAWSVGGNYPNACFNFAGAGTQTTGLAFAGLNGAFAPQTASNEYDGSAWSSGGSLGSARYSLGGCGTQTAALGVGGENSPVGPPLASTVLYDGTSWSTGGPPLNLATGRKFNAAFGTQSAAVTSAGFDASFNLLSSTENFNGISWSAGGALPSGRLGAGGSGTQTAGLIFGGNAGGATAAALTYNGSTWTATGSLTTARFQLGGAGTAAGTGIAFGGSTGSFPSLASTEVYS